MIQHSIYIAAVFFYCAGAFFAYAIIRNRSFRFTGILFLSGTGFLICAHSLYYVHIHGKIISLPVGTVCNSCFMFFAALYGTVIFITRRNCRTISSEQEQIRDNLEKYHSIFVNANEAFLLFTVKNEALEGACIEANTAACALLGYSADEIQSLSIDDIIIRSSFSSIADIQKAILTQNLNTFQMKARAKNGLAIPVEISFHAYSMHLRNYILMIMRDITERFINEQKIHIALKEKEVLLYEIHHRVKNNLQIISSLLDMVAMRVNDKSALDFLKDLESKIFTMSILHTYLYRHENFDLINVSECLRDIIKHLGRLYNTEGIVIHADCPDIFIPINTAIPVCLVINEALSNATRHAFCGNENNKMCTIWIYVLENPHGGMTFSVRDNGRGFPDTIDINTTSSIGIKLMRTIVREQLKGTFTVKNNNGTEIVIQYGTP